MQTRFLLALTTAAALAACSSEPTGPQLVACDPLLESRSAVTGDTVTTDTGLRFIQLRQGRGDAPRVGREVQVHYAGYLAGGARFDTSCPGQRPLLFPYGVGAVIPGFDQGLSGLREGGVRRIIIPPALGYGAQPQTDAQGNVVIPANSTLVFDVQLVQAD